MFRTIKTSDQFTNKNLYNSDQPPFNICSCSLFLPQPSIYFKNHVEHHEHMQSHPSCLSHQLTSSLAPFSLPMSAKFFKIPLHHEWLLSHPLCLSCFHFFIVRWFGVWCIWSLSRNLEQEPQPKKRLCMITNMSL